MILEVSVCVLVVAIEWVSGAVEIPDVIAALVLFDDGRIRAAYSRTGFWIEKRKWIRVSGGGRNQECLLCWGGSLGAGCHGREDEHSRSKPCKYFLGEMHKIPLPMGFPSRLNSEDCIR